VEHVIGHAEGAVLLDDVERRTDDQASAPAAGGRLAAAPLDSSAGQPPAGRVPAPRAPESPTPNGGEAPASSAAPAGKVNWALIPVVLLGLLGAYISFFTVRDSAVGHSFGPNAWALPIAIDLGIAAFTALDLRLTAQRARSTGVRLFPWFLNLTTVYLNAVDQPTWPDRIAHGALPIMWIAAVEASALEVHRRVAGPKVKPDRIPPALWVLAPGPTVLFWRRMRKQGIVSYAEALERDMHRRLVRARLRREFGRFAWRWSAPDEQLELYRMGKLVAVDVVTEVGASPLPSRRAQQVDVDRDDSGTETGPDRDAGTSSREGRPRTRDGHSSHNGRRSRGGDEVDVSHLLPRGRILARALAERGIKLTRRSLTEEWRQDGETLSNRYAGTLVKALQAEGLG
jgi:hypothetical protein